MTSRLLIGHLTPSIYMQYMRLQSGGSVRHAARMAEAASGRVGRGEQGEARTANSTPNGGPHLELLIARSRLKTFNKNDLSIAHRTHHPIIIHATHAFTRRASPRRARETRREDGRGRFQQSTERRARRGKNSKQHSEWWT